MAWINWTGTIGTTLQAATNNLTGDIVITILSIIILITLLALALKIPIEFTAALILPILITSMIQYSEFQILLGITIIYLSAITAKIIFTNT